MTERSGRIEDWLGSCQETWESILERMENSLATSGWYH